MIFNSFSFQEMCVYIGVGPVSWCLHLLEVMPPTSALKDSKPDASFESLSHLPDVPFCFTCPHGTLITFNGPKDPILDQTIACQRCIDDHNKKLRKRQRASIAAAYSNLAVEDDYYGTLATDYQHYDY